MKIRTGGHQINMLQGPIWNQIPRFAFPVAATAMIFVAVMYYIHIHKRKGEAGQTAD